MQERYRIYQRGGKNFYAKDTNTGRAFSLSTSDEREAIRRTLQMEWEVVRNGFAEAGESLFGKA